MFKKIFSVILVVSLICFAGCGDKNSDLTIDDFISVFSENGIPVDEDNKPFYNLIGASDGITFEHENKVVIYVYDSVKSLNKAKEDYAFTKAWPSNGRFLLETENQDVIDIFNSVK